jgi:hypothetical protein
MLTTVGDTSTEKLSFSYDIRSVFCLTMFLICTSTNPKLQNRPEVCLSCAALSRMPQYFIDKNTDDKEKFSKQEMSV